MTVKESATSARALATEEPVGRSAGWWGMVLFIATEAALFAALFGSYFYLRFQSAAHWPPAGIGRPDLTRPFIMTGLLVPTGILYAVAVRGIRKGRQARMVACLAVILALGLAFVAQQCVGFVVDSRRFAITSNAYGSIYYSISGLHLFHALIGLLMIGWLLVAPTRGSFGSWHCERVVIVGLYWQFVVLLWLASLFTIDLSAYI